MKVVGTGAPRMLTVRVRRCEVGVLRDVMRQRRSEATRAVADLHSQSRRLDGGAGDRDIEDFHEELALISRLLDGLAASVPADQPKQIVGPTWLLAIVIRDAAREAIDRLSSAVHEFCNDIGTPSPDEVRAALDTAGAATATLIGLDHAENYAVDR